MAKTANINIRIDPEVKSTVDGIFSHFGITAADAVNIFLHKVMIVGGMPFDMTLPKYNEVIQTLRERKPLDPKRRDHALTGDYAGFRECHIQPDWLLIYSQLPLFLRQTTHTIRKPSRQSPYPYYLSSPQVRYIPPCTRRNTPPIRPAV